VNDAKMLGKIM